MQQIYPQLKCHFYLHRQVKYPELYSRLSFISSGAPLNVKILASFTASYLYQDIDNKILRMMKEVFLT
jgi:hypothetical protein